MKKFCAIILCMGMLFSLSACGKGGEGSEYASEQSEAQNYTQLRYIQEKIIPSNNYDMVMGFSASDFGLYLETSFLDNYGVLQISKLVLDDQNQLLKTIDDKETNDAETIGDIWDYPVITHIMNDGRLAVLSRVVPRLDDESNDWDNTYSVVDIIDWQEGTQQRFELDAVLNSASNKILYDGQYIGFYSPQAVGIYQTDGQPVGIYQSKNRVEDACFMADGSVAVLEFKQGLEASEDDMGQIIRFDPTSGEVATFLTPTVKIERLLDAPHDEEYFSFYFDDGSGIKGIDPNKQPLDILNWVGAGVTGRAVTIESLSGRRFSYWERNGAVILKPTDIDMAQVSTLRLGTMNPFPIAGLVAEFNQINEKYQIELVDYSKMSSSDGRVTGEEQLDIDIVSGSGPDMFDLSSLPMKKYQQAGLLEDLSQYIQQDESLKNVEMLQGPWKDMETDGKLYTLVPAYGIRTFVGDPEYTGIERLDIPAMAKLFDEMEEGANPFGTAMSKSSFLDTMLNLNRSQFADWDKLTCNFNVPDFASLLEMAGQLPDYEDISMQASMMYTGEQRLSLRNILCLEDIVVFNSYLHENMEIYGLPTAPAQGTVMIPLVALGISVNCEDKQGAWAFLSSLLSDNYQRSLAGQALPLTQAGFDYIASDHRDWISAGGGLITIDPLGNELIIKITDERFIEMLQEAIDSITAVYNNDSNMMALVFRDAQACFAGDTSPQKAAEQIQSRAGIYMAEQYS